MEALLAVLLPFSSTLWNGAWLYSVAVGLSLAYARVTRPGLDVRGKHVLVTGGSTGLGLAVARKFAEGGASLTILSRNQSNLDNAKAAIEEAVPGCKVGGASDGPKQAQLPMRPLLVLRRAARKGPFVLLAGSCVC